MKLYKSPFLRDFWHLNVAMATSNNALVPDPDKEDILASKPLDWPLLRVGLRMCGWGDQQVKYYLVGLPVIWWGGTISLVLGAAAAAVYVMRQQRKYVDMEPSACILRIAIPSRALIYCCRGMGALLVRRQGRHGRLGPALRPIHDHGSCYIHPPLRASSFLPVPATTN